MSTTWWSAASACPRRKRRIAKTLRLQRQRSFSGGTLIDQLERLHALRLASVLEENQARHRQRTVPFGQGRLLYFLFHGAPFRERHLGRRGRLAAPPTTVGAHAGFLLGLDRRLPLGIFQRAEHHPVRLTGQRLLSVDAQRKVVEGQLGARSLRPEKRRFHHQVIFRGEGSLRRGDVVSRELGRNRHRPGLSVSLILGRRHPGRHALRLVDGRLFAGRGLPLCAQAEGGDPETTFQYREKSHSNLQANMRRFRSGEAFALSIRALDIGSTCVDSQPKRGRRAPPPYPKRFIRSSAPPSDRRSPPAVRGCRWPARPCLPAPAESTERRPAPPR